MGACDCSLSKKLFIVITVITTCFRTIYLINFNFTTKHALKIFPGPVRTVLLRLSAQGIPAVL